MPPEPETSRRALAPEGTGALHMTSREERHIQRLKQRDPAAFEELVRARRTPIFNMLYRMLGNREEAEDLLQEVFVAVFKQIDGFRGEASLTTWIYRIATNHCINRQKYNRRRAQHASESWDANHSAGAEAMPSPFPQPDEALEGARMERRLQIAISELDEEQRIVLVLRDIQNLSYEEIEQVVGVPGGTVKSRLHRARMALKEKLTRGEG